MRILLDARTVSHEFSGVGNYVLELVRAFSRLDADHEFVLGVWGESPLRELDLDERFRFSELPFSHESHPLGDLWEELVLPRRAARTGVDVLHGPAFLVPTLQSRLTTVVTIHDLVAFSHPETIPWKYAAYMRQLIRRAARASTRVITDSESVRRDIHDHLGVPERKVDCIPLGVPDRFRPADPGAVARVRSLYDIRRDYILFVGNLEPRKNLSGLVRAFRR
ncbi:MAG TPA: glycosyltransferase family 1 protein, partial [bacterium]|nr:glycosyltransferase family 1 protein [bacterium]